MIPSRTPGNYLPSFRDMGWALGCALALLIGGCGPFEASSSPPSQAVPSAGGRLVRAASLGPATAANWSITQDLIVDGFVVHVPAFGPQPRPVVLALHGMGGSGAEFMQPLIARADAAGWIVVAPTLEYGDWTNPVQVATDEVRNLPRLASFLERLEAQISIPVQPRAMLYGFSRGGQTANRFALAYPDKVAGVALMSCGTFTLPYAEDPAAVNPAPLLFPYGIADISSRLGRNFDQATFARIPFWVGVGERDSDPSEVPHQWDSILGANRVERAQRFAGWLRDEGNPVEVRVFPGLGHGQPAEVRQAAFDFLAARA